jgi:TPR repeat protein
MKNIQDAANEGKPQAEFELGCLLSSGEFIPKNGKEAFRLFLESAKQGYARAQYKLGVAYFNGEGVLKDQVEGLAWMNLSIVDGLPESLCQTMETIAGGEVSNKAKKRSQELLSTMPKEVIRFYSLKEKAPNGDAETQYQLGLYYNERKIEPMDLGEAVLQIGGVGDIKSEDIKEAVKWIRKAADLGYAPAQNELANLYEMNSVDNLDDKQRMRIADEKGRKNALIWWAKAAVQGYAPAQNNLAGALKNGLAVSVRLAEEEESHKSSTLEEMNAAQNKDQNDAISLYRKAADQGYALAQNNLGDLYMKGDGVKKDPVEAVRWFTAAADQGNIFAQSSLGDACANGTGVDKNMRMAIMWYQKAADQGDQKANRMLGNFYKKGEGVEMDQKKAIQYWEKAAGIGGDEVAMRQLGGAYFNGEGVEKDLKQAYFWHHRSGNLGDLIGAYETGKAHLNGWGVEKDEKQAKGWFRVAAINSEGKFYPPAFEQLSLMGEWEADLLLGQFYLAGKSIKSVDSLKKAASKGNVDAMFLLANAYYNGDRLPKDQVEGLAWMYLTAASDYNKKPSIEKISYPYCRNYNQFVNSGADQSILNILHENGVNGSNRESLSNNPNFISTIAKALSAQWEQADRENTFSKLKGAHKRAEELKAELANIGK